MPVLNANRPSSGSNAKNRCRFEWIRVMTDCSNEDGFVHSGAVNLFSGTVRRNDPEHWHQIARCLVIRQCEFTQTGGLRSDRVARPSKRGSNRRSLRR